MPEATNPIVDEIMAKGQAFVSPENYDAGMARLGGEEICVALVNKLVMSCAMLHPGLLMAPAGIQAAVMAGIATGVACADREREIEAQMRQLGME
jgi:hypothetical protein